MPLAPRTRALVGRSTELDRVRRATGMGDETASVDPGGAVLLSGDAGIGKSRLVAELADAATAAGHIVAVGHSVGGGGSALAWLPFVEIVTAIDELAPEATATTTALHPALAVLRPGADGGTDDPGRVAQAVHALLTEAGRARPLLVVIEDVHWIDHSSRDLLTLLLTRGFTTPVSLVVTYRSDDVHRRHPLHDALTVWTRLPLVTRIHLDPLGATDMGQLVRRLEDAPSGEDLRRVINLSGGNPFFAEELVASGESWSADLARLLRLRLERIDEPGRRVVRAASLGGAVLDPVLLAEVLDADPDELDEALQQSIDHHILDLGEDGCIRFRHALLGETVAQELLPGARRRLHQAWAEVLRRHPRSGASADLARHAAATGDLATAVTAAVTAGDEAMRVGGVRDAQRLYEAALGWVHGAPAQRAEITLAAAHAAELAGDTLRALDLLEESLPDLDPVAHRVTRARVLARVAAKHSTLDLPSDPVARSTEAMALVGDDLHGEAIDVALDHLDVLVAFRRPEAPPFADKVLAAAETLDLPRATARVRLQQARMLTWTDPARAYSEFSSTAADPRATAEVLLPALLRLGNLDRAAGRFERAYDHFLRGVEVADRSQRPWGPYALECRLQGGRTAYEIGRWDDAKRLLASPADLPQPPRGFMQGALVELLVARGETGLEHRLDDGRKAWDVDGLLVVATLGGMIDVLGRAGEAARLLDWVSTGVDALTSAWGPRAQALIRIGALLAGQTADLAARPEVPAEILDALRSTSTRLATWAQEIVDPGRDDRRQVAPMGREPVGPESLAWAVRLEAEVTRGGPGAGSDAAIALWRRSVDGFAALPHRPEEARSLLHLAEALHLAGDAQEADAIARRCREVAGRLGARPVLDALDQLGRVATSSLARGAGPTLTPRESEVLVLLERGRTNGQIAEELFISRKTASVHVSNILAKVGAATRGEAVSLARAAGLLG